MSLVVLHHRDADGFGAAFAVWKHLSYKDQQETQFIDVQYGEEVPALKDDVTDLMIVDFSFSREVCDELADKYNLILIDHHKTAAEELKDAPYAHINQEKAGCVLTWEFMRNTSYIGDIEIIKPLPLATQSEKEAKEVPPILQYVADRDLWKFYLPYSKAVNAYIHTLPLEFRDWDLFNLEDAIVGGKAIEVFQERQVKSKYRTAEKKVVLGHNAIVLNCTDNISEVGSYFLGKNKDIDIAIMWFRDEPNKQFVCSLRSRAGEVDVSEIAKKNGGGGHPASAGFVTKNVDFLFA
jgi:oligoribonuclease NrnB/cAMP/cGMP phosphodiesterase (DHH superfamily)